MERNDCFGLIFSALFSSPLIAVDCSPNDITLSTQLDVTNFQSDHGPCDTITGFLKITNGNDIADLSPLSALTSVGRELHIKNNGSLTNLNGLSALTSVGGPLVSLTTPP